MAYDVILHFDPVIDQKIDEKYDWFFPFVYVGPEIHNNNEWWNNLAIFDLRRFSNQKYETMISGNTGGQDRFIFDPYEYITF